MKADNKSMKAIHGYHLIKPEDLLWRPSNLMKIPNADYLERTRSEFGSETPFASLSSVKIPLNPV